MSHPDHLVDVPTGLRYSLRIEGGPMATTSRICACILLSLLFGSRAFSQQADPEPAIHKATTFQYTTLQVPGSTSTFATGVNSNGDIVGYYVSAGGVSPFLYTGGTFQSIPCGTNANGINDDGVIVGFSNVPEITKHGNQFPAFIYQNGDCSYMVRKAWPETALNAINNQGIAVGEGWNGPQTDGRGLIDINGRLTAVPLTIPGGINNSNAIAGTDCNHTTGVCEGRVVQELNRRKKSYTRVRYPDSAYTNLTGINDNDEVIGIWGNQAGQQQSFVYSLSTKTFTVFEVGDSVSSQPTAINNSGEIVGWYYDGTNYYGFYGYLSQ
jgi:hypothetical protein